MDLYKNAFIRNHENKNEIRSMPIRVKVDTDTNTVRQVSLCKQNVYYKEDWEYIFYEEDDETEEVLVRPTYPLVKLRRDGRCGPESSITDSLLFQNYLYQMRAYFHWKDNNEGRKCIGFLYTLSLLDDLLEYFKPGQYMNGEKKMPK
eukprot:scaffold266063_cov66-Cyclotella_meneghiniana.AAC.1